MATAPPTGPILGAPPPRRGSTPTASWGWDMSALAPMLNALYSRWGQAMDYQLQDLSQVPQRNELAFSEWLQKREDDRKVREYELSREHTSDYQSRLAQTAAERMAREAAYKADQEKRMALQAGVDRAHSMHTTYGGPTAFTPAGAVADFYEYGPGSATRSVGGSAREGAVSDTPSSGPDIWQVHNCLSNPDGPGCQGTLAAAGYQKNPQTGMWEQPPQRK